MKTIEALTDPRATDLSVNGVMKGPTTPSATPPGHLRSRSFCRAARSRNGYAQYEVL